MTLKAVLNLFLLPKNTTIIKFKILLMMIARAGVVAGQPFRKTGVHCPDGPLYLDIPPVVAPLLSLAVPALHDAYWRFSSTSHHLLHHHRSWN